MLSAEQEKAHNRPANDKNQKIVCLGDSLTFGYDVARQDCWVSRVRETTGWDLMNKGVNGDLTEGMCRRFHRDVVSQRPQYVFLMGGSNDLIEYNRLDEAKAGINKLVAMAEEAGIRAAIGIPPGVCQNCLRQDWAAITDFRSVEDLLRQYAAWLSAYGISRGIPVLSFYDLFQGEINRGRQWFTDGLHPSEAGHRSMAGRFIEFFGEITAKEAKS